MCNVTKPNIIAFYLARLYYIVSYNIHGLPTSSLFSASSLRSSNST